MTTHSSGEKDVAAVALLDEPNRRQLYELVVASESAIGRDAAAAALGISRELAAFHLDRLVAAGMLDTEFMRLGGRRGPGAGRPAKLYRRADREVAVSFPPRHYELAADLMATALDRFGEETGTRAAATVARERGSTAGAAVRRSIGARSGARRLLAGLLDLLGRAGYEPQVDASTGTLFLRNCPYHALIAAHRELTCGMNIAWAEGVVDSLGLPASAELAPEPGRCCVVFRIAPGENDKATA
jgi:predicted ArsR family transcriptional regulator